MTTFAAVARTTVYATATPPVAYEVTNLCGTVIGRTSTATSANQAGAVKLAKANMGSCYAIDRFGSRIKLVHG